MKPFQIRTAQESAFDVSSIAAEMIEHLPASQLMDCRSPGDAERAFERLRLEANELFELAESAEYVFERLRARALAAHERAEDSWLDWQARREAKQILDAEAQRLAEAETR